MKKQVILIAGKKVGDEKPCFITAEIGINHNGSLMTAKELIDLASNAGCDAVKFQKRTVDIVYSEEELSRYRESPFGTTNGDLKRALEFGYEEYKEIDSYCKKKNIIWYASCWDEGSVDFIERFNPPCYKIASACITDDNLIKYIKTKDRPIIMSTAMCTLDQIKHAVEILEGADLVLLHSHAAYPSENYELNLKIIPLLKDTFECPVGYSGHERGVITSVMAVGIGACMVERHITLDRALWGSDHAASLEPKGLELLVRDIRLWPICLGDGIKRITDSEKPIMEKLRRFK